jgi:hypothetical protein
LETISLPHPYILQPRYKPATTKMLRRMPRGLVAVEQWPTEAPEVSNTTENRSLEGHNETRQATSNNKNEGTNHTKEKMKVGKK